MTDSYPEPALSQPEAGFPSGPSDARVLLKRALAGLHPPTAGCTHQYQRDLPFN